MSRKSIVALAGAFCFALTLADIDSQAASTSGLTLEEALATGFCDEGDVVCLEELMAGDEDGSSDDGSSKDDDSKSDDKSSDDGSSKDKDGKSDDKSSKDDDSKSDDKSSDDKSSKDDDSKSDDKSSDDKSSKDDDSKSDDKSSDDKSSDDDSSSDGDSKSDDDSSSSDTGPVPNVSIGDGQGTEFNNITGVPVELLVSLDAPAPGPVLVDWTTQDGTAIAGSDYMATSGQISFSAGQQTANLTVLITGDDTNEPTESFFVRLIAASGAALADDSGEVTIFDDDDIDE